MLAFMSTPASAATENLQITGDRPVSAPGVPGIRTHLIALAGYLALALVATYPLILHFTTQVPGDLLADRDQNLWNLWWTGQAVTRLANPFHTYMLFYP